MKKLRKADLQKKFVIFAGFPRTGSTYLARILSQHPDVCVPDMKEINYFNKAPKYLSNPNVVSRRSKNSFDWYLSLFDLSKKVCADFSILTVYDLNSIERIKRLLGDVKIVFLTREKKAHMKSVYKIQKILGGIPNISYDEYLEKYNFNANYYSNLDDHIRRFKENFSHVKVFNLVDNDSEVEVKKIFRYLGIKNVDSINWDVFRNKSDNVERKRKFLQPLRRKIFVVSPWFHHKIQRVKRAFGLGNL